MRPAPELPTGRRLALVVATSMYDHSALPTLRGTVRDAGSLAAVLADPAIGGFTVDTKMDADLREMSIAVSRFLTDRTVEPTDTLLVYISSHGLVEDERFYFAARDTDPGLLAATAFAGSALKDQLERCRARKQIVILDCCRSGAFLRAKGQPEQQPLGPAWPRGDGRGLAILTASRAFELSYEGEPVTPAQLVGSVFTTALVEGLRTGDADNDNDGYISTEEAYRYAHERVVAVNVGQTPQYDMNAGEGLMILARSSAGVREDPPLQRESPENATARLAAELLDEQAASTRVTPGRPARVLRGAAGDLQALQIISKAMDDSRVLQASARHRPIHDVVALASALRALNRNELAEKLLNTAGTARDTGDLCELVRALREKGRPRDVGIVLAAVGGRGRTPSDTSRAVSAYTSAGETEYARSIVLHAGRVRTPSEIIEISARLQVVDGSESGYPAQLLEAHGSHQAPTAVAETLQGLAASDRDEEIHAVLKGVRLRRAADLVDLIDALASGNRDELVSAALGVIEHLDANRSVELVRTLRERGYNGYAEHLLAWIGWGGDAQTTAKVIKLLKDHPRDVLTIVHATESRDLQQLIAVVTSLSIERVDDVQLILRRAGRRTDEEVRALWAALVPNPALLRSSEASSRERIEIHTPALTALLAEAAMRPDHIEIEKMEQGFPYPHRWIVRKMIYRAIGRWSPPDVLAAHLRENRSRAADILSGITLRTPAGQTTLLLSLYRQETAIASRSFRDQATAKIIGQTVDKFGDVLTLLARHGHDDLIAELLRRGGRWHWTGRLARTTDLMQIAPEAADVIRKVTGYQGDPVTDDVPARPEQRVVAWFARLAFNAIAFSLGAAFSVLFAKPQLDIGDWFATVVSALLVLYVVGISSGADIVRNVFSDSTVVWFLLASLLIGLVLGLGLPVVHHWGFVARAWLAWNF